MKDKTIEERLQNLKNKLLAVDFRHTLIELGCEEHVRFIEMEMKESLKHYAAKFIIEELEEEK